MLVKADIIIVGLQSIPSALHAPTLPPPRPRASLRFYLNTPIFYLSPILRPWRSRRAQSIAHMIRWLC